MIKSKSKPFIFVGIYSSLVLSAIGSMAGTYAWFTYSGRVTAQFHGTALDKSDSLKVGLVSEVDLPEASNYGLTKDANSNIYWSEEGISAKALSYFFIASGYAGGGSSEEKIHPLVPVTSGSYETNGVFALKNRTPVKASMKKGRARPFYFVHNAFKLINPTRNTRRWRL